MKKHLFIIAFGLLLNKSHAQETFEKAYGNASSLEAPYDAFPTFYFDTLNFELEKTGNTFQQTPEGGFLKLSQEQSNTSALNIRISETNKYGKLSWSKVIGGDGDDIGKSLQRTADGGYVFTGATNGFGAGGFDVRLTKTDSAGNELWTRTYGGAANDYGEAIQQTMDGGYIIAGRTRSFGQGRMDAYVIKTDASGNALWSKTFGGADWDWANSVRELSTGGFIIAGTTNSLGAGKNDIYMIRLDEHGNSLWEKTIGDVDDESANSVQTTLDGGFIIAGSTSGFGAGKEDVLLVHTDANGEVTWSKTFGGYDNDNGTFVRQITDGSYVICGETKSFWAELTSMYLIKADSTGNLIWSKTYGGEGRSTGEEFVQTTNGGYAIIGATENLLSGKYETFLVRTDAEGNTMCHTENMPSASENVLMMASLPGNGPTFSGLPLTGDYHMIYNAEYTPENTRVKCSGTLLTSTDAFNNMTPDTTIINSNDNDSAASGFSAAPFVSKAVTPFSSGMSMNVYPNPGTGTDVKVAIHASKEEEVLVVVYDALGRENFSKVLVMEENTDNVIAIDPEGVLKPGVYMITATSQKNNFSKKLIIK